MYTSSAINQCQTCFCPFCNAHHNIGKYIKELSHARSNTVVLEQEDPFLNLKVDVLNEARTDDDDDLFQLCDELQNESWFQCFKANLNSSSLGRNFKIVHLNINSICLKLANVETLLNARIVDILVLQETKADCSVPNNLITFNSYSCIRCDRARHGGGLLIYVRDCYTITNSAIHENYETVCFSMKVKKDVLNFVISYKPPRLEQATFLEHLDEMLAHTKLINKYPY